MTKLKALLFSLDNVALRAGKGAAHDADVARLLRFVRSKGILPIVLANKQWTVTDKSGNKLDAENHFKPKWGDFPWYVANRGDCPHKPEADAIAFVLKKHNLAPNEVAFLGNDEIDMRTAVNGGVLFLTASWFASATEYGFNFATPLDVARFVDLFCLRDHLWFYEVPSIELRSLGLVSSYDATAGIYSNDAIDTFKQKDPKHRDFWTKHLVSTLYFANIHAKVDLIAPYPGHKAGHDNEVVRDALITFAKCFRKTYCPDLIVRHTTAMKSQEARKKGISLDHRNQLNTIHVTQLPSRYGAKAYKNSPFSKGRSILVVDDFTTEGYGLDSARAFLRSVPNVKDILLVSLLRFPKRDLHELSPLPKIADPFKPVTFAAPLTNAIHSYQNGVVDPKSTKEIADHFSAYDGWDWPTGI